MKHPLVCCALLLVLGFGQASAQVPPNEHPIPADGTHFVRRLLFELQFEPLNHMPEFNEDPAHTLVVVFGDLDVLVDLDRGFLHQERGLLLRFVQAGGAVLIASDKPPSPGSLSAVKEVFGSLAGMTVDGVYTRISVRNPDPDKNAYKGLADCPFIIPFKGDLAKRLFSADGHPLDRLATNQPSAFWRDPVRSKPAGIEYLAEYPEDALVVSPVPHLHDEPPWFAVGGQRGRGKVLLLADHSVLINMMMARDNDNVAFALNTFTWLREGPQGPRTKALFLEEGAVNALFQVPLKNPPLPRLPEIKPEDLPFLVSRADALLAGLEEEDVLDPAVQRLAPRDSRLGDLWAVVAALAGFLLFTLLVYALLRHGCGLLSAALRRGGLDASLVSLDQAVDRQMAPVSSLVARQRALIRGGNFWEVARALARQGFASLGLVPADQAAPPRVEVRAGFWERRRRRLLVEHLWRLACGPSRRVTAAELARVSDQVDQLTAWVRSGEVVLRGSQASPGRGG